MLQWVLNTPLMCIRIDLKNVISAGDIGGQGGRGKSRKKKIENSRSV